MDPGGALGYSPDYSGSYEIADHELHLEQEQESSDGCPGRLLLTIATSRRYELGERLTLAEAFMYSTPGLIRVLMADATDACGRVGGPVSLVLVSS
jgi:hypothetical protein